MLKCEQVDTDRLRWRTYLDSLVPYLHSNLREIFTAFQTISFGEEINVNTVYL